jgi:hypothetical protein
MKLEMRVYDLDVRLELNDDDNFDALEVLQNIKNLLEELKVFDNVNLSVISVPYEDEDEPEDDFKDGDDSGYSPSTSSIQTSWPFPQGGLDSMGTPVVQFLEPQQRLVA